MLARDVPVGLTLGVFNKRIQRGDETHVVNIAGAGIEQFFGAYQVCQALCSADSDVETVAGEQEVGAARYIFACGGRHAEEHHRLFLALEFVDCRDVKSVGISLAVEELFYEQALIVVGGDDDEILHGERLSLSCVVCPVGAEEAADRGDDETGFFGGGGGVALVFGT